MLPASCVMLRGKVNQALVSAPVATSGHLLLRQICCAWGGDSAACGQEFHYLRAEAEPGASALPRQAFTRAGVEDALKGRWYLREAPLCAVQGLYLGGKNKCVPWEKAGERPTPGYQVFIVTWEEN